MMDLIPKEKLPLIAADMRLDILRMVKTCGKQNGHLGGCLSAVEILAVIYTQIMNVMQISHSNTNWEMRDRFIMSKGHAGIALYAALKQVGLISQEMINGSIRGSNTVLYRHPKRNIQYGIECSVGSLGMGIGYGIGLAESFVRKKTPQKVIVMIGDGECDEGSIWEGATYASHRKLNNLIVVIDKNNLQLDGFTKDVLSMDNMAERWRAFGFETIETDGHSFEALLDAFNTPHDKHPLAIICNTVKGKGISFAENQVDWHDNYLDESLYKQALSEIDTTGLSLIQQEAKKRFETRSIHLSQKEDIRIEIDAHPEAIRQWNRFGSKKVIGEAAFLLASKDKMFSLIYSDCGKRIGIEKIQKEYPSTCYEVGISEQNQVCMAAAMAHEGFHVMAVAYAPFITARVLDQIRANLGYMMAPVCLIGLGSGLANNDLGATHTSLEDIANTRCIPNIHVNTPADTYEIVKAMEYYVNNPAPTYLRITINNPDSAIYSSNINYDPFQPDILRCGENVLIVVSGSILGTVLEANCSLNKKGINPTIINVRSVKPMSRLFLDKIKQYDYIITIEEHSILGGMGSAIAEYLIQAGFNGRVKMIGINDQYLLADTPANARSNSGLSAEGIAESIISFID